jgi:RNA polymerase sigma factor (sigma-70 family)
MSDGSGGNNLKGIDPDLGIDLVRALATLPPEQRKVVVLRHWMGMSVEEAAQTLRISQGTVKSQSAKALAKLRPLLDDPERSPQ